MAERMDLSKGVVPIVLVFGMFGGVAVGSWWASGVSRDVQALTDTIKPLVEEVQSVRDNEREIRHMQEEFRKLERDLEVQKSRVHHLSIAVGVRKELEEIGND